MRAQGVCPITQAPFEEGDATFVHAGVKFVAGSLRDYLLSCPGAPNPVNREVFQDEHVDALNAMFADAPDGRTVAKGASAVRRRDQRTRASTMEFFLDDDARSALGRLALDWDYPDDLYYNAVSEFRNDLLEISRYYMGDDDPGALRRFLAGVRSAATEMRVPPRAARDLDATLEYIARRPPPPAPVLPYAAASDDDDVDAEWPALAAQLFTPPSDLRAEPSAPMTTRYGHGFLPFGGIDTHSFFATFGG